MASAPQGLGWDVRGFEPDVRFGAFLLHALLCARDADRGPWAAHLLRTRRARAADGPAHRRLAAGCRAAEGGAAGGEASVAEVLVDAPGRPMVAAGPPVERTMVDATSDLANLIANAESHGIAVTWCDVDVSIGGFVYRPPGRTARRRDLWAAPRGLDARGLPSVTIGDLVVVLNPKQAWIETLELMLHELAHALLGHLGTRPSVRQAPDLIAERLRPAWDVREFEANVAAYVASVRRGDHARRVGLKAMLHFVSLERDGGLDAVDLLEIFRVAEVLAAWCGIRPQSVGVLAGRDRPRVGPSAGAVEALEAWEARIAAARERSKVPA